MNDNGIKLVVTEESTALLTSRSTRETQDKREGGGEKHI